MKSEYEDNDNLTSVWVDYQRGVMFNRSKNLYTNTEKNYNFYYGEQWEGANLGEIQPVVFNIVQPILTAEIVKTFSHMVADITVKKHIVNFGVSVFIFKAVFKSRACGNAGKHF